MTQPVPTTPLATRVSAAVRDAAVQASSPAIIAICHRDGHIRAELTGLEAADIDRYGAGTLLSALGEAIGRYHDRDFYRDVYGYALALPDHDVAYLVDINGTARTIALGPGLRDDADVRADAINGLRRMLDAATNPGRTASAFTVLDQITPIPLPPTNAVPPPTTASDQHRHRR